MRKRKKVFSCIVREERKFRGGKKEGKDLFRKGGKEKYLDREKVGDNDFFINYLMKSGWREIRNK